MFCSVHDFTFLMIDAKIKGQVSCEFSEKKKLSPVQFSVKFVMFPACLPARVQSCKSHRQACKWCHSLDF